MELFKAVCHSYFRPFVLGKFNPKPSLADSTWGGFLLGSGIETNLQYAEAS
jgi:hypothetical protein